MWNSIKRIICYTLGFVIISSTLPEYISFKEWCLIILGVTIVVMGTLLFPPNINDYE